MNPTPPSTYESTRQDAMLLPTPEGPNLESILSQVVITNRDNHPVFRRDIESGNFYALTRGFYLPKEHLDSSAPHWKQRRDLALFRHYVHAVRTERLLVFSHQSSLLLRGLPLKRSPLHIHERRTHRRPGKRPRYPAISLESGVDIPWAKVITHEDHTVDDPPDYIAGMPVSSIRQTARDILCSAPPVEAVAEVSLLMRHASTYDRWNKDESMRRAEQLREDWADAISAVPSSFKKRRALTLLQMCDPACESIAESTFLWFLYTFNAVPWQTQVEFSFGEHLYFADFFFPDIRVLIEIEGVAKLGQQHRQIKDNLNDLLMRDNQLSAQGWKVLHLTASQVFGPPPELFAHLRSVAPEVFHSRAPQHWLLTDYR
ncbi:hypothetical protein [Schaalia sp. Marseille-Q2122]|uniref:hypothetical protein n=1 Tax=Schaalia sp. Marseille-Q2122 TaxID=2736604 RepID=UPI00158A79DD|nr:hypothetical protein [Schaalia sp. Marseille-Q2122]